MKPSERALRKRFVDEFGDDSPNRSNADTHAADAVAVEWGRPDPEARPEGMDYDREDGTLRFDAWAAQTDTLAALDDETDLVAFLAGYGSGKSVFGARWTLANALDYAGSHFLVMGTTFSEARTSTFPKLFAQLPGENTTLLTSSFNGPEESPVVEDYNRQHNRLTLTNDTVITLGSADKWSRFAGAEFGGAWLDEPSHYESNLHDLLEMMGSRLRGVAGPKRQLWTLTGNGYNDAYEILEKRQDENGDPIGLNIDVVRASTLDNPFLSDGEKEQFKRQYADTGREEQALHGGFAAAQGLVYTFSRDRHVIAHTEASNRVEDGWRVYGYDAGWNDPRVLLEVGRTPYGQLIVLDEFHKSESHVEDAIAWLQENDKPDGPVFAEHEPSDIDRFRRAGWGATKAEKSIKAGVSEVRRRLSEEQGTGRVGMMVSEKCGNLIREFLGYKEEDVSSASASDHCLDSLRYLCMGISDHQIDERKETTGVRRRESSDRGIRTF